MLQVVRDRRLPPQGGLPPLDGVGGAVVEIACDESGFSGTNLLDAATPVFTHASVDLRVDEAAELMRALRSGLRWPLNEVKSGQFLRGAQAGEASEWLLARLSGRAHVYSVNKEYFLATRIVDLFLVEPSYAGLGARVAATGVSSSRPSSSCFGPRGGINPITPSWNVSCRRATRWPDSGWARTPKVSSRGSARRGSGLC
jgi:hypothetical protein